MTRAALRICVVLLLVGGVWLYTARGEVILMDLQIISARMLCF
jgi:hypothetical protein